MSFEYVFDTPVVCLSLYLTVTPQTLFRTNRQTR